jgi:3-deoxy-D-manno-octulosonic-acid transferase
MDKFFSDKYSLKVAGEAAGNYVKDNAGALKKIMSVVKLS